MPKVERRALLDALTARSKANRVVALVGMRQTGKSTLARDYARRVRGPVEFFDLEHPRDLARLADPMLALEPLRGLVVLDEIQHAPELFTVLRVLADRPRTPARFLVLGSASPDMLQQSAESLAGRISYLEVTGFSLAELGPSRRTRLWLRGGLPLSFLAGTDTASRAWRDDFVTTFLTRDVPQLGVSTPAATLRRFWSMLSHYHGRVWNASEFARAFGVSVSTVRRYLDHLSGAFAVRQLPPWFANIAKRQVKAPKVYLSDTGLLHALLGIVTRRDLERHPTVGASWEGFMIAQVALHLGARSDECYFWATHAGAELDLVVVRGSTRRGFEFKRTSAPSVTPSMNAALRDLDLQSIDVVHEGDRVFQLAPKVRAVGADRLLEIEPLR